MSVLPEKAEIGELKGTLDAVRFTGNRIIDSLNGQDCGAAFEVRICPEDGSEPVWSDSYPDRDGQVFVEAQGSAWVEVESPEGTHFERIGGSTRQGSDSDGGA